MMAAQHHQDIIETGGADLSNDQADERLVASGRRSFWTPILVEAPAASTTPLTMSTKCSVGE